MGLSTNINVNDYIIYFTTSAIDKFKSLFDTIQKLKPESFITFYKGDGTEKNPGKIIIKDMTNDNTIFYTLVIPESNLDEYYCAPNYHIISVDFKIIHDIIKNMSECNKLTFSISNYKDHELNMVAYTKARTLEIKASVNLLNDRPPIMPPDLHIEFIGQIYIGSEKLHAACKNLLSFGKYIDIICIKDKITLAAREAEISKSKFSVSYKSVSGDQKITTDTFKNNVIIKFDPDFLSKNHIPIIRSTFEIAHIINFDKLKSLVGYIDIRMGANNEPLCLNYIIPNIGQFNVCITSISPKDK